MRTPQAGSLRIIGHGVRLVSEIVIEHKNIIGNVTSRELIGFEVLDELPNAIRDAVVTWAVSLK